MTLGIRFVGNEKKGVENSFRQLTISLDYLRGHLNRKVELLSLDVPTTLISFYILIVELSLFKELRYK